VPLSNFSSCRSQPSQLGMTVLLSTHQTFPAPLDPFPFVSYMALRCRLLWRVDSPLTCFLPLHCFHRPLLLAFSPLSPRRTSPRFLPSPFSTSFAVAQTPGAPPYEFLIPLFPLTPASLFLDRSRCRPSNIQVSGPPHPIPPPPCRIHAALINFPRSPGLPALT